MGMIVTLDGGELHAEARRESFVLYTDFGDKRIELDWKHLDDIELLVHRLKRFRPNAGPKST